MDLSKIWSTVLGELEISLSKANFTTWFKDTFVYSFEDNIIVLAVPNVFTKEWLQNKYHNQIFTAIKKAIPDTKTIEYKVTTKRKNLLYPNIQNTSRVVRFLDSEVYKKNLLKKIDADLNFKNFVVGDSNKLAHAASMAVAKNPGKIHNPLFIYGGVGLGKTHLMQAIGNEVVRKYPEHRILYVSCEKFTNEFIQAIRTGKTDQFKKHYRGVDTLLLDDVHFLAGKESTQEEFFHTFNDLHQAKKQIVISSDRPPKAIPTLEERLKSRFAWGMIADIQPPSYEMRKAILQTKASQKGFNLQDEISNYIAENIHSNIRELEGALNRIIAYFDLNQEEQSLDSAVKALSGTLSPRPTSLSFDKILEAVINFYNIKLEELIGIKRKKEIVIPRQVAMYLLRNELGYSYPQIAARVGKKDHTTVMYACNKIEKQIRADETLQKEISLIKEKLY